MRVVAALAVAAIAAGGGCVATSPDVTTPGSGVDAGQVFADVVLGYSEGGVLQVCSEALPTCDVGEPEPCGPPEVLGPPDSQVFALEAGGRVDLGFRCTPVVERGGTGSPDVAIWATVPSGSSAVIEVSEDGAVYQDWVELTESNQRFDLATIQRTYIRFLRIADRGEGGISIDAVEALQPGAVAPPDAGAFDGAPATPDADVTPDAAL